MESEIWKVGVGYFTSDSATLLLSCDRLTQTTTALLKDYTTLCLCRKSICYLREKSRYPSNTIWRVHAL